MTPLWIYLLLAMMGAVALGAAVYYAVELPAMRVGARINRRDLRPLRPPTARPES